MDRLKVWCVLQVEPRIIDDELFLRVQHWIAFDRHQPPTFKWLHGPSICPHINIYRTRCEEFTISKLLRCQIQHVGTQGTCPTCSVPYRCNDCDAEFKTNTRRLDDRKVAVVVTKWLDMGSGYSQANPKWRRHIVVTFKGQPIAIAEDSLGPKSIFEGYAGSSRVVEVGNR